MKTFYSTLSQSSYDPKGYLKIEAPDEVLARKISRVILGDDWAFIYKEEGFNEQIEEFNLHPIEQSPIIATEDSRKYWESKFQLKKVKEN